MCFPMALRPSSADHDAVSPSPNHLFPESDSDGAEGHDIELTAASPEKQADLPAFTSGSVGVSLPNLILKAVWSFLLRPVDL